MKKEPTLCRVDGEWYDFVYFDELPNVVYLLDRKNPRFITIERVDKWKN